MFGITRKNVYPIEVVDITNPTMQSILGKYFIGQTDELTIGNMNNSWGALINPIGSGINIFFDIFTITNFSAQNFTAEVWFNAKMPGKGINSTLITPSNLTLSPAPKPKVLLQFANQVKELPTGGVNVFDRIVTPNSTLISDSSKGGIIIGPGGSFSIFLKSPGAIKVQTRIVLTWWEEKIENER